jgi:hypothetical protein
MVILMHAEGLADSDAVHALLCADPHAWDDLGGSIAQVAVRLGIPFPV